MRAERGRIAFYAAVLTCNVMTIGMFKVLNMPLVSAAPQVIAYKPVRHLKFQATVGTPVRLVVPDLGIDVPVANGTFDTASQTWTISDTSAYYAVGSVPVNDSNGTTLLYGHARANMFAPLKSASASSIAYVYTDNSKKFTYRFESVRDVDPSDTSVFTDAGPPTLVMQTCDGPWDRYRALYSFSYAGVENV